jgi:hypothetical protein
VRDRAIQTALQIRGIDDRPHLGRVTLAAERLGRIQGRNSESDMTDVPIGRKVFVGEDHSPRWPARFQIRILLHENTAFSK